MMSQMIGEPFGIPFQTSLLIRFAYRDKRIFSTGCSGQYFQVVNHLLMCVLMKKSRKYEVDRLLLREKRLESMPKRGESFLVVTI
jgi:hypothetical protein